MWLKMMSMPAGLEGVSGSMCVTVGWVCKG